MAKGGMFNGFQSPKLSFTFLEEGGLIMIATD
jgi:hypothetical protein